MKKQLERIVIKVGSSLFYPKGEQADVKLLKDFSRQVARLRLDNKDPAIVSSGAIALGMSRLGLGQRPKELSMLQAVASLGQNEMMETYRKFLGAQKLLCGQILLTWDDFSDRARWLNAKNTLVSLFSLGAVPVINENDTVSTEEIKFGDNDQLSALVASLISADLLIILSDVPGLLEKDKKTVVRRVTSIDESITSLATETGRKTSVGGMVTKLKAARIAADSGIPCVIADGREKDIICRLSRDPESSGTLFCPERECFNSRQRWIAFGTRPKGTVSVDDGAVQALARGRSLLSVGVTGFDGAFESGDIVAVMDGAGKEVARGKIGVSASTLEKVKGIRHSKEVIHRDNLVLLHC